MSGPFLWKNLIKRNFKTALFLSSTAWIYLKTNNKDNGHKYNYLSKFSQIYFLRFGQSFMNPFSVKGDALSKKQREQLMSKQTDVYVWGNGYQVDFSLDYNNFFPKKISNFDGEGKPQIIIVKFGMLHEAYLDKDGKIHLGEKHKLSSMKLPDSDDRHRSDMITLEIKGRKIIDIGFTDRSGGGLNSN